MSSSTSASDRWRRVLAGHRASGLSVAEFCRRAGIPSSSFFYWQRRLRDLVVSRRRSPGAPTGFVEVLTASESEVGRDLAAGARGPGCPLERGHPRIEVWLPGRRRIAIRPGFDRKTLRDLLTVLEADAESAAAGSAAPRSADLPSTSQDASARRMRASEAGA